MKVPKPRKRVRVSRKTLKRRTRMEAVNRKRGGSSFPKQRDKKYRRWIRTENACLLRGDALFPCVTRRQVTPFDKTWWPGKGGVPQWRHICFGPVDPAHVGKHQAQGAPDVGAIVPLCRAAHSFYDEHRSDWRYVTGYSEKQMASAASGYALKYVESGGVLAPIHPQEHP